MKEKITAAKQFICFYMTLPLFVFLLLVSGIGALDRPVRASDELRWEVFEASADVNLFPIEKIWGEPTSPDGSYPIVAKDMSKDYDILNSTDRTVDEEELLSRALPYPYREDMPLVLVVHTHGSECYADAKESFSTPDTDGYYGHYTSTTATRSLNCDENVVAVGEVFCETLAREGVRSIQCRIMHDKDDYNSSYANSRETIKEYLEKYPTIKYVIDLHRDALGEEGKEKTKTVATLQDGCAQVMLVAGCHGNGVNFPYWEDNLSVALKFKKAMDEKYPSLSRPIYLRHSRYNLDLTRGSLLLEVGTCSNTLDEAKRAASLAAECFADILSE